MKDDICQNCGADLNEENEYTRMCRECGVMMCEECDAGDGKACNQCINQEGVTK